MKRQPQKKRSRLTPLAKRVLGLIAFWEDVRKAHAERRLELVTLERPIMRFRVAILKIAEEPVRRSRALDRIMERRGGIRLIERAGPRMYLLVLGPPMRIGPGEAAER